TPAPRPRNLSPPVPPAALRRRAPTPPAIPAGDERLKLLPKLPPGASGEFLEADLLEEPRVQTEEIEIIELAPKAPPPAEPQPKPQPKPAAAVDPRPEPPPPDDKPTPIGALLKGEAKPFPRDGLPPRAKTLDPVDRLPSGTFAYPTAQKRSKVPLVIGLMLLAALVGAGVVLFLNRTPKADEKKQEVARGNATADAPTAESVAALDAAVAEPDTTEVEIIVDPPDAGVAPKPPKQPRPPKQPPRIATGPVDAAPSRPDPRPPADAGAEPVATAPDAAPAKVPVPEGCDETTCVLENYAKACCARWKPTGPNFGQTLDKTQIRTGVERVKPAVIACGEKSSAKGTVTIAVTVDAEGAVTSSSVQSAPDDTLGSCVAAALRRARFAKTAQGGTFSYPFVF
ncbi:MAG: AgmX/PglI C-terminal domain-containing protein, partial [Deltaproteobacteria bacterium]|nr:AgmX/PglI C-terminal domain-containing protein [Deltaproteobacteria bacterium]